MYQRVDFDFNADMWEPGQGIQEDALRARLEVIHRELAPEPEAGRGVLLFSHFDFALCNRDGFSWADISDQFFATRPPGAKYVFMTLFMRIGESVEGHFVSVWWEAKRDNPRVWVSESLDREHSALEFARLELIQFFGTRPIDTAGCMMRHAGVGLSCGWACANNFAALLLDLQPGERPGFDIHTFNNRWTSISATEGYYPLTRWCQATKAGQVAPAPSAPQAAPSTNDDAPPPVSQPEPPIPDVAPSSGPSDVEMFDRYVRNGRSRYALRKDGTRGQCICGCGHVGGKQGRLPKECRLRQEFLDQMTAARGKSRKFANSDDGAKRNPSRRDDTDPARRFSAVNEQYQNLGSDAQATPPHQQSGASDYCKYCRECPCNATCPTRLPDMCKDLPPLQKALDIMASTVFINHIPISCRVGILNDLSTYMSHMTMEHLDLHDTHVRLFVMYMVCILRKPTRQETSDFGKHHNIIHHRLEIWHARDGAGRRLLAQAAEADMLTANGAAKLNSDENDQRVLDRCKRYAQEGCPSKALQQLLSSKVVPPTPKVVEILQTKHPKRRSPIGTYESDRNIEPLHVSQEDVAKAVRSFPSVSSGGHLGFKPVFFKELLEADTGKKFIGALTSLVNYQLKGCTNAPFLRFLADASLTALEKKGGGVRPIACGEFLRRLTSKCALKVVSKIVFLVNQLGVCSPGGAERLIHRARNVVSSQEFEGMVFCKVDLSNAFNNVSRAKLTEIVRERAPKLLPYFLWAYEQTAKLHVSRSGVHIDSDEGTQQGDPLGPLLFALVLDVIVREIDSNCNLALNLWYLDDGNLVGSPEQVHKALDIIARVGPDYGIFLNLDKCHFYTRHTRLLERVIPHFPNTLKPENFHSLEEEQGFEVLGSPIGGVHFCETFFESQVIDKLEAAAQAISELDDPHIATYLLRNCVSFCRAVYLMRTVPPSHIEKGTKRFDDIVIRTQCDLLGLSGPKDTVLQMTLSTKLGGLGLRSAWLHRQAAYVTSVASSAMLDKWSDNMAVATEFEASRLFLKEQTGGNTEIWFKQFEASAEIDLKQLERLLEQSSVADRARLLSLGRDSALAWLRSAPSEFLGTYLAPAEFVAAIRGILGITPEQEECGVCHEKYEEEGDGGHFAHSTGLCMKGGGKTRRHHRLRDTLVQLARYGNMQVRTEVSVDGSNKRPGDLVIDQPGKALVIDVAVTQPQQKKYRERAAVESGYAAKHYEEHIKNNEFKEKVEASGNYTYCPFVMEVFGATTDSATRIIRLIARAIHTSTSLPYSRAADLVRQRVSAALWKGNVKAVLERTTQGAYRRSARASPASSTASSRAPSASQPSTPPHQHVPRPAANPGTVPRYTEPPSSTPAVTPSKQGGWGCSHSPSPVRASPPRPSGDGTHSCAQSMPAPTGATPSATPVVIDLSGNSSSTTNPPEVSVAHGANDGSAHLPRSG